MTFLKGNKKNDLRKAAFDELIRKFQKCHDEIWEGGKRDPASAFDEFTKILIAKIYDERFTPDGEEYQFQIKQNEKIKDVSDRIKKLYEQVKERNSSVFKVEFKLPDNITFEIVKILQELSLRNTDLDIKGRAFEKFLGKVLRDENGQYFTPRNVVKCMVEILDPDENDLIIDPACGSGGFLLYSLMHVIEKISKKYKEDKDSLNRIGWDFAHKQIFGIEINDRIARIAMMDMIIHEDGHSNIECNNALLNYDAFEKKREILPKKYSLVFTNPPFGAVVKDNKILRNFDLRKDRDNQKTEILFIERCLDLLKEKGKIGIVLPDSILTNSSLQYVRDYITKKSEILAVISLPQHTFVPSGASVKSSLLFVTKRENPAREYNVFMAIAKHIGFDSRGKEESNELQDILDEWRLYSNGKPDFNKAFLVKANSLHNNLSPEQFVTYSNYKNWEAKTLSELCDGKIFTGKTPARDAYTSRGYKILKVRDLTSKGIEWDNNERAFISLEFFNKNRNIELKENDILFISAAHHPKYIGQKIDIIDTIPERYKNGIKCSAELMVVRVNPNYIDPYYVLLFLKTEQGYKAIQSCIRGQTAHIYPKDIKNIKILIPPKKDANKIIDNLKKIKQALESKSSADEDYFYAQKQLFDFIGEV